jgi:predicted nuclease of predicted toxin-antitoxin system
MKFKIDENLPVEIAEPLQAAGYDAITVVAQKLGGESDPVITEVCRQENRILVTLDLDFADIQTYPPQDFPGIIVLRVNRQEKPYLISVFQRTIPLLTQESVEHRLWIVEETRVRIRGGEETN